MIDTSEHTNIVIIFMTIFFVICMFVLVYTRIHPHYIE